MPSNYMTQIKTFYPPLHLKLCHCHRLDNGVQIFSLQFNFVRPSIFDLETDKNDPSTLSVAQTVTHNQTYTKFLQYKKSQNYDFVNY